MTLETDQFLYIDSGMGHAYLLAPGCEEAWVVAGCTGDDEKLMDSLAPNPPPPPTHEPSKHLVEAAEKPARKPPRAKSQRR